MYTGEPVPRIPGFRVATAYHLPGLEQKKLKELLAEEPPLSPSSSSSKVVRVYLPDGAYRSLRISDRTTAVQLCADFTEKAHLTRFKKSFQLKEVTPQLERVIGRAERIMTVTEAWEKDPSYQFSLQQPKWKLLFCFTEDAQKRLARRTLQLSAQQAEEARAGGGSGVNPGVGAVRLPMPGGPGVPLRPTRPPSAYPAPAATAATSPPATPPGSSTAAPASSKPAEAPKSARWDRKVRASGYDPSKGDSGSFRSKLTIGEERTGNTAQDDSVLPNGGSSAVTDPRMLNTNGSADKPKTRLSAKYLEDALPVIGGLVPSSPKAPLPPGGGSRLMPRGVGSGIRPAPAGAAASPVAPASPSSIYSRSTQSCRGPSPSLSGRSAAAETAPPPAATTALAPAPPPATLNDLIPPPPPEEDDDALIPPPPIRESQHGLPPIDQLWLSEAAPPPEQAPPSAVGKRPVPAHRQRPTTLYRGGASPSPSPPASPALGGGPKMATDTFGKDEATQLISKLSTLPAPPPSPYATTTDNNTNSPLSPRGRRANGDQNNPDEDGGEYGQEGDEELEDEELAALLLQHGAVQEGNVNLGAALGGLVSFDGEGDGEAD